MTASVQPMMASAPPACRMQTNPELYNGSATLALRTIVESDGELFEAVTLRVSGCNPTR